MINKPIVTFAGLAVAAVVAVAGVTKNQWMPPQPETIAPGAVTTGEQASSQEPAIEEKAPEQKVAAVEQSTVTEQPATETTVNTLTSETVAPSFDTVRVEKTGEALIAGRAQPGSEVTVMLDGKAIGTTTANGDGAFVLTTKAPLPTGSGALTVESKIDQQAAVQSETSVAVVIPAEEKKDVLVAVVSPDEPTKILQKTEPVVADVSTTSETAATVEQPAATEVATVTPPTLDAVDYDESGNIVFSGSGQPNAMVRLYVDNAVAGDAQAGSDGRWSFAGSSPIVAGKHTLRVDGIDSTGAVLSRVELPFFREEPTKVASATTNEPVEATTTTATETITTEAATQTAAETTATIQGETAATDTATTEAAATKTDTETAATTPVESEATEPTTTETTITSPVETITSETATTDTTVEKSVAATTTTEIAKPKDGRIVIQPGNNLWRISRVIYGSGTKYTVIFESNKDQIRNANLIYPGQVFMTPDIVPPEKIDPTRRDSLKPEEGGGAG